MTIALAQDTAAARTVSGAFGTASDGETWGSPLYFTSNSPIVGINNNEGYVYSPNSSAAVYGVLLGIPPQAFAARDVNVLVRFQFGDIANGPQFGLIARWVDANNYYLARIDVYDLKFEKVIGGTTTLTTESSSSYIPPGTFMWARFVLQGTTLSFKYWQDGTAEPNSYTWVATDTSLDVPGYFGLYFVAVDTTLANGIQWDSFSVSSVQNIFTC